MVGDPIATVGVRSDENGQQKQLLESKMKWKTAMGFHPAFLARFG